MGPLHKLGMISKMTDGVLMIIHIYPQGRLRTAKVSKITL